MPRSTASCSNYVVTRFEEEREDAEPEVNAILEPVHNDYVTLRRLLVDEGLLEREAPLAATS